MEDYEQEVFNKMRKWLDRKNYEELMDMSDEEVKQDFTLRGGSAEDVVRDNHGYE